jgi:hypothetical protein
VQSVAFPAALLIYHVPHLFHAHFPLQVRLDCSFFLLRNTSAFPSASAFSDAAPSNSWALLSQTETLTNQVRPLPTHLVFLFKTINTLLCEACVLFASCQVKNMCMGVHTAIAPPPSSSSSMQSIRIFFSTTLPPPLTVQYHQLSCSSPPCSSAPSSVTTSARSYSSADLCGGIAAAEGERCGCFDAHNVLSKTGLQ